MPFEKNNELWKESHKARKEKETKLDAFLLKLASTGSEAYSSKMDKLERGEDLSKPEKEYMDRLEGWREYIKPKLARTEGTLEVTGLNPILDEIDKQNKKQA